MTCLVLISLCLVLRLCCSFKGCALYPSLLFSTFFAKNVKSNVFFQAQVRESGSTLSVPCAHAGLLQILSFFLFAGTQPPKPHWTGKGNPLDDVPKFAHAVPSARLVFPSPSHQPHSIPSTLTNCLSSFKTQCRDYVLCKVFSANWTTLAMFFFTLMVPCVTLC